MTSEPARDGETREDFHAWEHAPQDELIRSIAYTLDDLMRFWAHPDNVELIQRTRRHLDRQFAEFDRRMAMPPARDGETLSDEPTVRDVVRYIDTVLAPALGEPGTPVSFGTWWMFRRAASGKDASNQRAGRARSEESDTNG